MLKVTAEKKRRAWTIKLSKSERKAIQEKADLHTDGNFSEWVRAACIAYQPKKRDLA